MVPENRPLRSEEVLAPPGQRSGWARKKGMRELNRKQYDPGDKGCLDPSDNKWDGLRNRMGIGLPASSSGAPQHFSAPSPPPPPAPVVTILRRKPSLDVSGSSVDAPVTNRNQDGTATPIKKDDGDGHIAPCLVAGLISTMDAFSHEVFSKGRDLSLTDRNNIAESIRRLEKNLKATEPKPPVTAVPTSNDAENDTPAPSNSSEITWQEFVMQAQSLDVTKRVRDVVNAMKEACTYRYGNEELVVFPYGSSANGFLTRDSDIDLCVRFKNQPGQSHREGVLNILENFSFHVGLQIQGFTIGKLISEATVPILKLTYTYPNDNRNHIAVDLSVNNGLPLYNTLLLKRYSDLSDGIAKLAAEVKTWAKQNDLHGADRNRFSSYALNLMTLFYLQARGFLPCLQTKEGIGVNPTFKETPAGSEADVSMQSDGLVRRYRSLLYINKNSFSLKSFLEFYVNDFQWGKDVVSVRLGKKVTISELPNLKVKPASWRAQAAIFIEDPFATERNLGSCCDEQTMANLFKCMKRGTPDPETFKLKNNFKFTYQKKTKI